MYLQVKRYSRSLFINRDFWMPARRALCLVTSSQGSGLFCKMEHITWWIPMKSLSSVQEKVLLNKVCCAWHLPHRWVCFPSGPSEPQKVALGCLGLPPNTPPLLLPASPGAVGSTPGDKIASGQVFIESVWGKITMFSFLQNSDPTLFSSVIWYFSYV